MRIDPLNIWNAPNGEPYEDIWDLHLYCRKEMKAAYLAGCEDVAREFLRSMCDCGVKNVVADDVFELVVKRCNEQQNKERLNKILRRQTKP